MIFRIIRKQSTRHNDMESMPIELFVSNYNHLFLLGE